jgi:hypothetical protein
MPLPVPVPPGLRRKASAWEKGQTKKGTLKPRDHAVARASLWNVSRNAACLHYAHKFNIALQTQALKSSSSTGVRQAAVSPTARWFLANTGKEGVPSFVVVTGMLTLLAAGCWQLILMLKGKEFAPDATGKTHRIVKVC